MKALLVSYAWSVVSTADLSLESAQEATRTEPEETTTGWDP